MAEQANDLLTLVPAPVLSTKQQGFLSRIKARKSSAVVHVGRLTGAPGTILQSGQGVGFQLAPGLRLIAVDGRVTVRGPGDLSWAGTLQGVSGAVQLVLTAKGITATVTTSSGLYRVEPIGGGLHAIVRVGTFPPEHSTGEVSGASVVPSVTPREGTAPRLSGLASPTRANALAQSSTAATMIDVLVAYTPGAAAGSFDIAGLIQLAIDETNASYANSRVDLVIRGVFSGQVNYSEAGRIHAQHVAALQSPTDGVMDEVHTWRDQYHADVVILLVDDGAQCGFASAIYADQASAFASVHYGCATGNYSFAHEIGHLQGARHDLVSDATDTPFQYGHGYVDPNRTWRTIMALPDPCGWCVRVQYWSNPFVNYPPTGQPMGTTTHEHDARVLDETKVTLANFRNSLVATLTGPNYSVGHTSQCQWTANVTGGAPPYSYYWSATWTTSSTGLYFTSGQGTASATSYAYYYGSYPNPTPVTVRVSGTDASGQPYSLERTISLYNNTGYGYEPCY